MRYEIRGTLAYIGYDPAIRRFSGGLGDLGDARAPWPQWGSSPVTEGRFSCFERLGHRRCEEENGEETTRKEGLKRDGER